MTEKFFNYVLLRAVSSVLRFEMLNAGVIVFDEKNTCVRIDSSKKRLRALHPDFGRINLSLWAEQIQDELRKHPEGMQRNILPMMCAPFIVDKVSGETIGQDASSQADFLFSQFVERQGATLTVSKNPTIKHTKLIRELRDWLKASRLFSSNVEDLSNHRVVANYPVIPVADLYADFALMNGKLHVIETLDLRGVNHLTPTMRGDAAIKGITLDEAKKYGNAIAVFTASDYGIARPAISMISRYADDLYDLSTQTERQRFADFMATSLHHDNLALPLQ